MTYFCSHQNLALANISCHGVTNVMLEVKSNLFNVIFIHLFFVGFLHVDVVDSTT